MHMGNMDMSLYMDGSSVWPALNIGVMCAFFQSDGVMPVQSVLVTSILYPFRHVVD